MKINTAGSIWLLAVLLFVFGCDGKKQKPDNPPSAVENVPASQVDSLATSPVPEPGDHRFIVEINKMKFIPDQLAVHKGDTVVWVNNDLTNHCITQNSKGWTSSIIEPGKFWKKVITKNEDYFCAIHVVMKGKVLAN